MEAQIQVHNLFKFILFSRYQFSFVLFLTTFQELFSPSSGVSSVLSFTYLWISSCEERLIPAVMTCSIVISEFQLVVMLRRDLLPTAQLQGT